MENIFIRICPRCEFKIAYSNKYVMQYAEARETLCKKCSQKGKIVSEETRNKIKNKGSVFQKEFWIKKGLSEQDSINKIKELQSKIALKQNNKETKEKRSKISHESSPFKKETWIKKGYTEKQAEFEVKSRRSTNIEYWLNKGFSEENAKKKLHEKQSIASKRASRKNLPNQISYWLNKGFSEDQAKQKVSEFQRTFTLQKCIAKHGEVEGRKRWIDRQNKWIKNYRKKSYSFISQDLFWKLYNEMNFNPKDVKFATFENGKKTELVNINNEERLFLDTRLVLPDFIHLPSKKIIEFDGVYYHRKNPENKKREQQRDKDLERNGYKVFHVNEFEYKQNPEKTIEKCKNFLK